MSVSAHLKDSSRMLEVLMGRPTFGLISGIPAGEQQGAQKHQNRGRRRSTGSKTKTEYKTCMWVANKPHRVHINYATLNNIFFPQALPVERALYTPLSTPQQRGKQWGQASQPAWLHFSLSLRHWWIWRLPRVWGWRCRHSQGTIRTIHLYVSIVCVPTPNHMEAGADQMLALSSDVAVTIVSK